MSMTYSSIGALVASQGDLLPWISANVSVVVLVLADLGLGSVIFVSVSVILVSVRLLSLSGSALCRLIPAHMERRSLGIWLSH